jgi:hypothetical protein
MTINEVKSFRDDKGRTVLYLSPDRGVTKSFMGVDIVKTTDGFEKQWEFVFPPEVQTLTEAFNRFDEVFKKRLEHHNSRAKGEILL